MSPLELITYCLWGAPHGTEPAYRSAVLEPGAPRGVGVVCHMKLSGGLCLKNTWSCFSQQRSCLVMHLVVCGQGRHSYMRSLWYRNSNLDFSCVTNEADIFVPSYSNLCGFQQSYMT